MSWEMIVLLALIGAFVAMFFNLVKKIGDQVIARFLTNPPGGKRNGTEI